LVTCDSAGDQSWAAGARRVRVVALDLPTNWAMVTGNGDDFTARMLDAITAAEANLVHFGLFSQSGSLSGRFRALRGLFCLVSEEHTQTEPQKSPTPSGPRRKDSGRQCPDCRTAAKKRSLCPQWNRRAGRARSTCLAFDSY